VEFHPSWKGTAAVLDIHRFGGREGANRLEKRHDPGGERCCGRNGRGVLLYSFDRLLLRLVDEKAFELQQLVEGIQFQYLSGYIFEIRGYGSRMRIGGIACHQTDR
jgi:hypothetical protein